MSALWMIPPDHDERHKWMAMILRASIAFQVRGIRIARGWTQNELAEKCSESVPTISRIEDPQGEWMNIKTLTKIAAAFDVALDIHFASWPDFVETMPIPPAAFSAEQFIDEPESRQ